MMFANVKSLLINASIDLETLNALYSIICVCALFIFARYWWLNRDQGYYALRPVTSIMTIMLGEFIVRGTLAYARHLVNNGHALNPKWFSAANVGALIACFGTLCVIRVFSPYEWGHYPWIVTAILAATLTYYFVFLQG